MENTEIQHGQPWEVLGSYASFRDADSKRTEILLEWAGSQTGYSQVKIKRRKEDGMFTLKARRPIVKNKKKKNRKKKNGV
tara:strand:+ start:323 stop:562 length:240 start_codon:yes stop_codon:yes gene_type:complete